MGKRVPKAPQKRVLYHHTPMVTDQFDDADLYSSQTPLPGIDLHNNPRLFQHLRENATAPDWMFRQGLAAPPLDGNESGLRHYEVAFNGDPRLVINLDAPLHQQTPEVQAALAKVGVVEDDPTMAGQPIATLLWERGLIDSGYVPQKTADQRMRISPFDLGQQIIRPPEIDNPDTNFGLSYMHPERREQLKNQAAPAILDALRTAEIPAAARQGSGVQAGSAYAPLPRLEEMPPYEDGQFIDQLSKALKRHQRVYQGTKDYKVFDPRSVDIIRALAVPGAIAAGSAASSAEAANPYLARPDEGLSEYFQRVQPKKTSGPDAPEPSMWPYAMQELMGTAQPLDRYSRDFPEMQEYQDRAAEAYWNKPSIRTESGTITPAEFVMLQVRGENDPMPAYEKAVATIVLADLTGKQASNSPHAQTLLQTLQDQGVGGKDAVFQGQTELERDKRRNNSLQEWRYITSQGQDQNLAATRAYNLLSAMQTGQHKPVWSDAASSALGAIGSVYHTFLSPAGEHAAEMRDLEDIRNQISAENPVRARAMEALYWDNKANQAFGSYRDSLEGAYYPQYSWTTGYGMNNQGNMDNANWNTRWSSAYLPQALSGTPIFTGDDRGPMLRQLIHDLAREVPVVPHGATAEEAAAQAANARKYLEAQENKYINEYPMYQRSWNDSMDNLGQLGDAMRVENYSYPSPANNMVTMAPKYWADPMTVATLGAATPVAAASGGLKALAKSAAMDFVTDQATQELPFSTAVTMSAEPYRSRPRSFFEPMAEGNVMDGDRPADPNAWNYPDLLDKHRAEQEKLLGGLLDYGRKYYPQFRPRSEGPRVPGGNGLMNPH